MEINQRMEAESTLEKQIQEDEVENDLVPEVQLHLESTEPGSPAQRESREESIECHSISAEGNLRSASSARSSTAASLLGYGRRSSLTASSSEEVVLATSAGLASSRGRLSSCSTVLVMEEQLMLNPTKPEVGGRWYM